MSHIYPGSPIQVRKNQLKIKNKNNYFLPKIWKDKDNKSVSCTEKIKILNENILEIKQLSDEAIEDAELMGVDSEQVIAVIIDALNKK